jgi:hypothetical protein
MRRRAGKDESTLPGESKKAQTVNPGAPSIHTARLVGHVFVILFELVVIVSLHVSTIRLQPDEFGSQSWGSRSLICESDIVFFLFPFTLLLALKDKEDSRSLRFRILHWVVLIVLFVWFLFAILFELAAMSSVIVCESIGFANADCADPFNQTPGVKFITL